MPPLVGMQFMALALKFAFFVVAQRPFFASRPLVGRGLVTCNGRVGMGVRVAMERNPLVFSPGCEV